MALPPREAELNQHVLDPGIRAEPRPQEILEGFLVHVFTPRALHQAGEIGDYGIVAIEHPMENDAKFGMLISCDDLPRRGRSKRWVAQTALDGNRSGGVPA